MIRPKQIPEAAVKAALLTDERHGMREVIAAALAAWPEAWTPSPHDLPELRNTIILPLSKETRDE